MDRIDIDEAIASANNLISSVYRDLEILPQTRRTRQRRNSVLTVSPAAQMQINNIDRHIQAISNGTEATESAATNEENVEIVASTNERAIPQARQSVEHIPSANERRTPPARRRNEGEVVDIIDLCSDSPDVLSAVRNPRIRFSGLNGLVNLVSPTVNSNILPGTNRRRRNRQLVLDNETVQPLDKRNRSFEDNTENNIKGQMMCPICMESYVSRQPTTTKCGHLFCKTCILQSLKVARNCPVCRTKINERSLIRLHL